MAGLIRQFVAATSGLMLILPISARAQSVERWDQEIREAAFRFQIHEEWIRRVMKAESGGKTLIHGQPITSRVGAMGLMQLMPTTWLEMRAAYRLGPDPFDPHDNVIAGAAYLRAMYDRFGYPGLFAAYNAGPNLYSAHLSQGRPLPSETRRYVAELSGLASLAKSSAKARTSIQNTLFAFRKGRGEGPSAKDFAEPTSSAGLFALRH